MKLSVTIIARNEAEAIRDCLESVRWADQIVVLDSASSDGTADICREFGAQVWESEDWPGFGPQKNRALGYATGEWVLSLDADERVTPELRAEIERVLAAPDADAYRMPRLSRYLTRYMRHSGWHPDHVLRLFRRGRARFSDDLVHERLIVEGRVGTLASPLLHEAFTSAEEVLEKVNRYSSAGAEMALRQGRRATLAGAVLRGLSAFVRTYLLKAGFLDGREGFMLAVSNAEGAYYRYLKLMLLAEGRK
ncbi:MAG TPA: glycosyltransferase family 2 protein [Burkholderiales bacterium]|nr:glycosyltransferase family 2 protein [Burkholderiales bacterium]